MNKTIRFLLACFLVLSLGACKEDTVYKVGATPVPHAEILEFAKPLLEAKGFTYEVVTFTDYVLPNRALDSGELVANFFQHIPYLEAQIADNDYDFTNVGGVHVEPIGLYSKEYSSVEDFPTNLELIISSSPTDRPRLLGMLEENGLIALNPSVQSEDIIASSLVGLSSLFTSDYTIQFIEVDPALLFTNYNNQSGDAVLINGNYALDNGLNPLEDALFIEGSASLYVNILVVNSVDVSDPFIEALIEVLKGEEVKEFILENYGGAVVPVN